MAVSLIQGRKAIGTIGELVLDARIDENHQLSNDVTQYPVEEGSNITDHVRNRPFVLTMTGHVTNSPIEYVGFDEGLNRFDSTVSEGAIAEGRSYSAYDVLITMYNSRILMDVQTTLNLYENMIFQDLVIPRNSSIGGEIRFTATLVQVTKAKTEFAAVNIDNVKTDEERDKRAAADADKGKQNTSEPTETSKSLAASLLDSIGG